MAVVVLACQGETEQLSGVKLKGLGLCYGPCMGLNPKSLASDIAYI